MSLRFVHLIALQLPLAVALPGIAVASTIINGGNLINQTWTPAGSPYIVMGDVIIPPGSVLTIQAGSEVQFASNDGQAAGLDVSRVEMITRGSLLINGTGASPVTLRAQSGTSAGIWYGIVVENVATSVAISHATVSHAAYAIRHATTGAQVTLTSVTLAANDYDLGNVGTDSPIMSGRIEAGKFSGSLTVSSSATLALNRTVGLVQSGDFTLDSGATYEATLTSVASFEKLQVQGGVDLSGALALDVAGLTASNGDSFTLLDNDAAEPVQGQFSGLPHGSQFDAGAYRFQISYTAGGGNDVALTVVPPLEMCDVDVVKSGPAQAQLGEGGITYLLTVSNSGPSAALDVVVRDTLPPGLLYVSAVPSQGSCSETGNRVTCSLGSIAAGVPATIQISTTFNFDTVIVVNAASATTTTTESNGGNNTSSVSTRVAIGTTAAVEGPAGPAPAARDVWTGPNPSRGATRVFFRAPAGSRSELRVFDVAGRAVRRLVATVADDRDGVIEWDGRTDAGVSAGSGVFFYEVLVNGARVGSTRGVIAR